MRVYPPHAVRKTPNISIERIETLGRGRMVSLAQADDLWRSRPKMLVVRDALDPALLGEFFMIRKVEPHEQLYRTRWGAFGLRFRFGFGPRIGPFRSLPFSFCLVLTSSLPLARGFLLRSRGSSLDACGIAAVELVQESLIQAEGLLPAFKFVTRLLSRLFVCAEIERKIGRGHEQSVRRQASKRQAERPMQAALNLRIRQPVLVVSCCGGGLRFCVSRGRVAPPSFGRLFACLPWPCCMLRSLRL